MTWGIDVSDRVAKDLRRLDLAVAARVLRALEAARTHPGRAFLPLRGGVRRKLRVGDHRVIVRLDPASQTIFVLRVGHRRNVYDE